MDDRGHWHPSEEAARESNERIRKMFTGEVTEENTRPVIGIAIGEGVFIQKKDGQSIGCTFDGAEKNKVTLTPKDDVWPYLDFAEHVELQRANGESVKAQVWDNRKGKIILRTLPF